MTEVKVWWMAADCQEKFKNRLSLFLYPFNGTSRTLGISGKTGDAGHKAPPGLNGFAREESIGGD